MTVFTDQINGLGGSPSATDAISGGGQALAFKAPVRAATTANITLSGLQTIDGVSLAAGDRVLVKNQSLAVDNGIWIVSTGAWTRATDMDSNRDLVKGTRVAVTDGTVNATTSWQVTAANIIEVGTDDITFSAVGSAEISAVLNGTAKATPVLADRVFGADSANSFGIVYSTWTQIKAALFDPVYQPASANLTEWSGINPSADGASLVSAANYAAMVTALAITVAGITDMSANARSLNQAANYAAMRALLDLESGTDFLSPAAIAAAYQPIDADLTSWAGVTRASGFDTFATTPSSANLRSLLTDESGTGVALFQGTVLTQADSGQWFENNGATINRLERVMVGAARANLHLSTDYNDDWLSTYQEANGGPALLAAAQMGILNDVSSTEAGIGLIAAAQSTGKTGFVVAQYNFGVNNETGSDVHTFAGAFESHRRASAGVTVSIETQSVNWGSSVASDPYGILTATGRHINITFGSGGAYTDGGALNPATAAMVIFRDTEQFNTGLIVGENSIVATGSDSLSKIMTAPSNYALAWYSAAATISGTLRVNTSAQFVVGTATAVIPNANDGASLGVSGTAWSDMFLASGGVINFNAGDVTITHSSNTLTFAGADSGYLFDNSITLTSTDAGATTGPNFAFVRDSASPAANDELSLIGFYGKDSTNVLTAYAAVGAKIIDPNNGSEDGQLLFYTVTAGSLGAPLILQAGVMVGTVSADPGAGHLAVQYGIATGAPVTKTGTSSTIASTETSVIFNASGTHTVTLPAASSFTGRWLYLKTRAAQTVNSASSNVKPLGTDTAGTAILTANAGRWAFLQSDGTNWVIMAGVV